MRRTKEDAEKTRKAILDAALEVFHQQGVSSAGLAEIAKRADVTRGAVYWHFKDKQDLYFALYDSLTEEFRVRPEDFVKKRYETLDDFLTDIQRPLKLLETDRRYQMFIDIVYSRMEYVEAMKPIIENEQIKQRALLDAYIHALEDLQVRGFIGPDFNCSQYGYILYFFVNGVNDACSFDPGFSPEESRPSRLLEEMFKPIKQS
ncbi:MAG: TetR family transcriptional regulator [Spirochaetales bacterium]|nr:TetR family transcriptional regulator [Spirochaetales bacterium]